MSTSLIKSNSHIVEQRKKFAVGLRNMKQKVECLLKQVNAVKSSPLINPKPEKIDELEQHLRSLCTRLANKVILFENGTITISVAGMEKSGKSTMLKTLTGIDLPTADRRCTVVACEILYAEDPADEKLELVYYTEDELLQVVREQLENLCMADPEMKQELPEVDTLDGFAYYSLPELSRAMSSAAKKKVLANLRDIQHGLNNYRHKLGNVVQASVDKLSYYASHTTEHVTEIAPDQSLISKIRIHKHFEGGGTALRLCDTPGVNDPNPQALKRTFKSLREETDMLVILHRPGDKVSMDDAQDHFFENVRIADNDAPMLDRTIYMVNYSSRLDGALERARMHIDDVRDNINFSHIEEPIDVMNRQSLLEFITRIHTRLESSLPKQDGDLMRKLTEDWNDLRSNVQKYIYNSVKDLPIGVEKLEKEFDKWFSKKYGDEDGFIERLRIGFGDLTEKVESMEEISALNAKIEEELKVTEKDIHDYLIANVTEERCLQTGKYTQDPGEEIMSELSQLMSRSLKTITDRVIEIGPLVQRKVVEVIKYALREPVFERMCSGDTPEESIKNLCDRLRKEKGDERVNFIVQNLEEFAKISDQMAYITRYELRPALNMFDSQRWREDRRVKRNNELAAAATQVFAKACSRILISSGGKKDAKCEEQKLETMIEWLTDIEKSRMPGGHAAAKAHVEFFGRVCSISLALIKAVVMPQKNNKIYELVEDFIGQASQTLSTQKDCENGWRYGLGNDENVSLILQESYARMRSDKKKKQDYDQIIKELREALS